jgi:hypothetical protein
VERIVLVHRLTLQTVDALAAWSGSGATVQAPLRGVRRRRGYLDHEPDAVGNVSFVPELRCHVAAAEL